jgi:hypothetical protein
MAVIINELESVVEAPSSPAPPPAAGSEQQTQAAAGVELARALRRMARRAARLAAD